MFFRRIKLKFSLQGKINLHLSKISYTFGETKQENRMKTSVTIWVDYEEFKPETYKGCYLVEMGKEVFRSSTGKFGYDYRECFFKAKKMGVDTIYNSSSVDNWHMDKSKRK